MATRTASWAIPWVLAALSAGCLERSPSRPVGASCDDGRCDEGLICLYGRCRSECLFDADCPPGTACVASDGGSQRVCTAADEACDGATGCPDGLHCWRDGLCHELCGSDGSCAGGRTCACADDSDCEEMVCVEAQEQIPEIESDDDDGEVLEDYLRPRGEHEDGVLFVGRWSYVPPETWAYFRFTLAQAIPDRSIVVSAELKLWGLGPCYISDCGSESSECGTLPDEEHALRILAADSADASRVQSPSDVPTTTGTDAAVAWPMPAAWPEGERAYSPDLSSVFQELVDRYDGLDAGAHVLLWVRGDGYDDCVEVRVADSYWQDGGGDAQPAQLDLRWHERR